MAIELTNPMTGDAFKAELENAVDKRGDTMNDGATLTLGKNPEGNMDAATKIYVDNKVIIGSYIGAGAEQTIDLGVRPKAVYIADAGSGLPFIANTDATRKYYGGFIVDGSKPHKIIEIVDTGFTVKNSDAPTGIGYYANQLNRQYNYIAWV